MTITDTVPTHVHISEREPDGSWEDCTWDAGLEWYRDCFDASRPATHAEAQALRKASGEPATGGSNIGDFRKGVQARYHVTLPMPVSGFAALWDRLAPGTAALSQGSMSAFGPTHPLSRYDRNFDGSHAVYIARLDAQDRVWWCDPEAPKGTYNGQWVTKDDLAKFVRAFSGQHLVAPLRDWKEDTVFTLTSYTPGFTGTITGPANIREDSKIASRLVRSLAKGNTEKVTLLGTVKGDTDPATGSTVWYVWWEKGKFVFTASDNVKNIAAPVAVDDSYTKATQDAAVAAAVKPLQSQIAGLQLQVAGLQPLADLGNSLINLVKRAAQ